MQKTKLQTIDFSERNDSFQNNSEPPKKLVDTQMKYSKARAFCSVVAVASDVIGITDRINQILFGLWLWIFCCFRFFFELISLSVMLFLMNGSICIYIRDAMLPIRVYLLFALQPSKKYGGCCCCCYCCFCYCCFCYCCFSFGWFLCLFCGSWWMVGYINKIWCRRFEFALQWTKEYERCFVVTVVTVCYCCCCCCCQCWVFSKLLLQKLWENRARCRKALCD